MTIRLNNQAIDQIVENMIQMVDQSKHQVFEITEEGRKEYEYLSKELESTKKKVKEYIKKGDHLEKDVKKYRQQLALVSKDFNKYSENEVRKVYEKTHDFQTKLIIMREEEKLLRQRRDEIEIRLTSLTHILERGEELVAKIAVIFNFLQDDFKQVNEMIEDAREKQEFGLKIIEAQEEERKKLSREIHDGPAQMLANVLLRSDILDYVVKKGSPEEISEEIKSLRKNVRVSLQEVRRIIYDLRPMALDDLGVVPTIRKYVDRLTEYHNIHVEFIVFGEEKRLNNKYEVALFRLMQEAAQNAIKHSEATEIKVKLEILKDRLILIVTDNGKGFNPAEKSDNSFGLIGMRERVEMLDGDLKIITGKGKGTTVTINVPYSLT
ncbi:sensor histidine kinase [Oceanobacillus neutriphilus]|uniref:Signal transduction histidine-protein kinase/phosphatase DegS n=1 Tax=Oceanobacillus neutriphilus TaxID=531815 RepID=A0ABQ2NM93_9BACI|nr:sensor histidine kinase [Oceanobacillus neutriphilus]GGP06970.1 signal transduction histidine-protein kinase/phosphatase DegS [Oceanobacillus neutriphilus]